MRLDDRCRVHWEFDLPRLSSSADRMALKRAVRDTRANVVFIDPLYLCLFDGVSGAGATNLYEVGPALRRTAKACLSAGATPVFVHHANKSASRKTPAGCRPLTLEGLAFAGIGEFARQWMLLNRRGEYQPGSGHHQLVMAIGGSTGHSSVWNVRADESQPGSWKRGWQVKVSLWKPPQPEAETPDRSRRSLFADED